MKSPNGERIVPCAWLVTMRVPYKLFSMEIGRKEKVNIKESISFEMLFCFIGYLYGLMLAGSDVHWLHVGPM